MKKNFLLLLLLIIFTGIIFTNCGEKQTSKKMLIVHPKYNESDSRVGEVSEVAFIEQSLKRGGEITVNVDTLSKIDSNFEKKYAVVNSKGSYIVRPAILNFISDKGWEFKQYHFAYKEYWIFVK